MLADHLTYLIEAQEPADLRRLAEHLPYAWIERAVQATGAASIRRRRLPAEQVVWLVIALMVSALIGAIVPDRNLMATQILSWVWQVLAGSFTAVYTAILYHDLRAVREGIGIDEIASVFD